LRELRGRIARRRIARRTRRARFSVSGFSCWSFRIDAIETVKIAGCEYIVIESFSIGPSLHSLSKS